MKFPRRRVIALSLAVAAISGVFASTAVQAQDKKELVIGATAGPYSDQVKLGIKPILEKKGYRVRIVEFNDYVQPNFALAQGSLDANVFQHIVYLTKFATENKLAISELIKVPTAPIALYSHKHKTLDVKEGAQVALPSDPTNAARALVVLQDIGWVKLRAGVDPTTSGRSSWCRSRPRSCRARWTTSTTPSSTATSRSPPA
jgi:D-methionine transport system substrate-binding protein